MIGCDANLELRSPCDGLALSAIAHCIIAQFGLSRSQPNSRTRWNFQSFRSIDCIEGHAREFCSSGSLWTSRWNTFWGLITLVFATVRTLRDVKLPRRRRFTKCGKWRVDLGRSIGECKKLHDGLESGTHCIPADKERLNSCQDGHSFLHEEFRRFGVQDPLKGQECSIPGLDRHRGAHPRTTRTHSGEEAHVKTVEIVVACRTAKQAWLSEVASYRSISHHLQALYEAILASHSPPLSAYTEWATVRPTIFPGT